MRKALVISLLTLASACGGGGGSPSNPTSVTPTPQPTPTPVPAAFAAGQHLGVSGRYFADPPGSGCYWERNSGLGGSLGEIIANDFIGYDSNQVIVDVLASDVAFTTDGDCGSWFTTPRQPAQSAITPGTWLVGGQIQAGTYQANVGASCYWERVSDFQGGVDSIIANDFISDAGPRSVTISAGDAGFTTDGDCGTWTRASGATDPAAGAMSAPGAIARARAQHRALLGLR